MATSKTQKTVICLLRNDLRYHDNEALLWAHKNADFVLPLYCFDPDHYKTTWRFSLPKTAQYRAKFLLESVTDLRSTLQIHGSNLIIRQCQPLEAVTKLTELLKPVAPVTSIVFQQEVTYEELNVEKALVEFCKKSGIHMHTIWGSTLFHKDDIPYKAKTVPDTYTQFRKGVENQSTVRNLIDMPKNLKPLPPVKGELGTIPDLKSLLNDSEIKEVDQRSAFPFMGGEQEALSRLGSYLWGTDSVAKYKETRNGLLGENYSTKLSPWLANGSLSPRMVYHRIKQYEEERVANHSTYWVLFELIWRDYFKFVCLKYGDRVFYRSGIMGKSLPWKHDKMTFKLWCEGKTGVPFVDANMRELKETGWMSNRGRQNVASFLIKDLGLDWRYGAEWFESLLLDHDVCSNYGNWNYAAGIGNDPREGRKFNMVKQGLDYDPDGDYIKTWVPELAKIPGAKVHVPWTLKPGELRSSGVELGVTYPNPIVIAPEWARHTSKTISGKKPSNFNPRQKGVDFYFKSANNGPSGSR
ncbi:predicted protein [Nematostella vectensis]|uniref:Cryptochrome DASH n=2 Tax=Nematostella vectensis TaxID=45351 RepID=A7SYS9_NEMVE|nr:predicted protein [Nematostella vectensis]|eukprot:XP_001623243.1 predicted protein [Nematostella vectensis]